MAKDYEKFVYMKQVVDKGAAVYHSWYLMDKQKARQGVHFHGHVYKGDSSSLMGIENQYGFFASGIEGHSQKPKYSSHTPVKNCIVTGGDCYCDGSSLQASERLGWVNPDGSDDDYIWNVLHEYYGHWVTPIEEASAPEAA